MHSKRLNSLTNPTFVYIYIYQPRTQNPTTYNSKQSQTPQIPEYQMDYEQIAIPMTAREYSSYPGISFRISPPIYHLLTRQSISNLGVVHTIYLWLGDGYVNM